MYLWQVYFIINKEQYKTYATESQTMLRSNDIESKDTQRINLHNMKDSLNNLYMEKIHTQNAVNHQRQSNSSLKNGKYSQKNMFSANNEDCSNSIGNYLAKPQNNEYKKQLNDLLYDNYKKQIEYKQQRNKQIKNRQRQQQIQFLKRSKMTSDYLTFQKIQKKENQKNEILNQYQRSLQLKMNAKIQKQEQKMKERQKLSKVHQTQKQVFYKEFYNFNNQRIYQSQMNYIQQVSPQLRSKQLQLQKIASRGMAQHQHKMKIILQEEKKMNILKREQLRNQLQRQIQQKKMRHRRSQSEQLSDWNKSRYSDHNTIVNPISYKVNPENKYILNEIRKGIAHINTSDSQHSSQNTQQKSKKNIGISPLVRNGSQVLI